MSQTVLLQAVTSVRVGCGHAVGAVDLPLDRERHTGWPCISGASLKGALRGRAEMLAAAGQSPEGWNSSVLATFGPPDDAGHLRGALEVSPAVLLALPVRSLKGACALLTSPLALGRLARAVGDAPPLPSPSVEQVLLPATFDAAILHGQADRIALEDLAWLACLDTRVDAWVAWLRAWVGAEAPIEHLAVVHDDVFAHATRHWTVTRTRASLDAQTGVVADGKLFTVELLPPETLWWMSWDLDEEALRKNQGVEALVLPGTAPYRTVLPGSGEAWSVGGHRSTGNGRVAWYRRTP